MQKHRYCVPHTLTRRYKFLQGMGLENEQLDRDQLEIQIVEGIVDRYIDRKKFGIYALLTCITFVSTAIGTIATTYFTEKISAHVVKSEFGQTLERIEKTVSKTESIQQEIRSKYLDQAEARKVLRKKFEEIYVETIHFRTYLDELSSLAIKKEHPKADDKALSRIQMLQALYFPRIEEKFIRVFNAHTDYRMYLYEFSTREFGKSEHKSMADELVENQKVVILAIEELRRSLIEEYSEELNL